MAITLTRRTIIDRLKQDHERMRDLFETFEEGDEQAKKEAIAETLDVLFIHDKVEKKLLYPAAAKISSKADRLVRRSREAHHVVNALVMELSAIPSGRMAFAKFETLMEGVRSHMEEEEDELFPLVEGSELDLKLLGDEMEALKTSLTRRGGRRGSLALMAAVAAIGVGAAIWLGGEDRAR